ncbi:hypothetical protein OUZ56_000752 [Daphnia magna]|uniref:Uncharacterized protein n=1 Tax=Daphnia magna TaxID=35525 RepID=A0ABR0A0M7_9CRUS|nr:hypothetical protein OUZ56_000752 [Daphnia magna]
MNYFGRAQCIQSINSICGIRSIPNISARQRPATSQQLPQTEIFAFLIRLRPGVRRGELSQIKKIESQLAYTPA